VHQKQPNKEQIRSEQSCTQASILAVFPLITARDRRCWSHWDSLGSPDILTSFFVRQLKKGGVLSIHTSGFNCNWLEVESAFEVIEFLTFCTLRPCSRDACLSGSVFVVAQAGLRSRSRRRSRSRNESEGLCGVGVAFLTTFGSRVGFFSDSDSGCPVRSFYASQS